MILRSLATLTILTVGTGCGALQQDAKAAHDIVVLADDACVLIRDVAPNDPKGKEICAKEEELRKLIPLIESGRAKKAAPMVPDAATSK